MTNYILAYSYDKVEFNENVYTTEEEALHDAEIYIGQSEDLGFMKLDLWLQETNLDTAYGTGDEITDDRTFIRTIWER